MSLCQAHLGGSELHPYIDLHFSASNTEVMEWVRNLPDRAWNPDGMFWRVTGFGIRDIDAALEAHGFTLYDSHGHTESANEFSTPLAIANSTHPTYSVAVYPRLAGKSAVEGHVGVDALWKKDGHVLARPENVSSSWCTIIGTLPDVRKTAPPRKAAPPKSKGDLFDFKKPDAKAPLHYDGTLDGLRGVPLSDLRCMKHDTQTAMNKVGIHNVYDVLHRVPRRYIDMTNPMSVEDAPIGSRAAIVGTVTKVSLSRSVNKKKPDSGWAIVEDPYGNELRVFWFRVHYGIIMKVKPGSKVILYGEVSENTFRGPKKQMLSPLVESVDNMSTRGFIGIYPASATNELTTWVMHAANKEACNRLGVMLDPVASVAAPHDLPSRHEAFRMVHDPNTLDEAKAGRDRLAYDELLRLQLTLMIARNAQSHERGIRHIGSGDIVSQYLAKFPWPPTNAQQRCIDEIRRDLESEHSMNRILQGDVGSGKSMPLFASMLHVVEGGHQAALMVPLDNLAVQHAMEVGEAMEGITHPDGRPVQVALMHGRKVASWPRLPDLPGEKKASLGTMAAHRRAVIAGLADGSIDIVVGTTSLLAADVQYARLGLAVIDETHKFGVEQRNALRRIAHGKLPDVLYATATPIPRSMVMTIFGDLEVSTIDEYPPGRSPVETQHVTETDLSDPTDALWDAVRAEVEKGHQAFVVCSKVAQSEAQEAKAAQDAAIALKHGALRGLRIGVATGKDEPDERSATLAAFRNGELDVLVATTIIEVGINVPNATYIVILDADRFGLAQLHQLRGRVGRGRFPGSCALVTANEKPVTAGRMEAMVSTTDGFRLAELDLELRGTGSLLSGKQSGSARELKVAKILEDTELVEWAKKDAAKLLENDPTLSRQPYLRFEIVNALGDEAGEWMTSA